MHPEIARKAPEIAELCQRYSVRLLQRPVDLIECSTLEKSRNYIRRKSILRERESVYG